MSADRETAARASQPEAPTGIDEMLRAYADALIEATREDEEAGPNADTDPDCDRAWERVAMLRTMIGLHIRELEDTVARLTADAARLDWLDSVRMFVVPVWNGEGERIGAVAHDGRMGGRTERRENVRAAIDAARVAEHPDAGATP